MDANHSEMLAPTARSAVAVARAPRSSLDDLPRPVAVVVSGGGVLGAAHAGVGYALEQRGFVPDLIVGTSVGALTGAVGAAHPHDAAQRLQDVWVGLSRRDVFPVGYFPARTSVCGDRGLRRLIERADVPARIEQLPVPFVAVATDLATGDEVTLDHGNLTTALLASTAIPGILPPVERDGRTLVDGGVVSCVPVRAARLAGAASVLVLTTGAWTPDGGALRGRSATAVALRAYRLRLQDQVRRDLREVATAVPTVVLPTGVDAWPAAWDFDHSQRLIRTAYETACRFLDDLRIDGPGLYTTTERAR
ncbi:patatin-like phospholipase family protein [Nocardioides sp. NBC_00368]|uniref:patatin-like phospholipase family protein n=1 Tax=Nocardioides sp. NBC_00368 TaxID=2976000 RepID=UPI002E1C0138